MSCKRNESVKRATVLIGVYDTMILFVGWGITPNQIVIRQL